MAEFKIPEKIIYGQGSTGFLSGLHGRRLLLVTDCPEAISPVQAQAAKSGLGIRVFCVPRGAAESPAVQEGAKALMEFKPDWTAALGGFGALDCAKLMCIFYQRPELTEADLMAGRARDVALEKTRLIAIPLINTDGGEAMGRAVLLQGQTEAAISCPGLLPGFTLLDEDLLPACPEEEDSPAVLSVLTLALEAAVSPASSSFTLPLSTESLRLIAGSVMAYAGAPGRRSELLLAQALAGMAHFNSGPGLCSAMIRAAAVFGLRASFGQRAALFLPAVLRAFENPIYDGMAAAIGLKGKGRGAASLASMAEEYADMLGLALSMEELGLEKNAFLKRLSYASRQAAQQEGISELLGENAQKRIEELYRACYPSRV